VALPINGGRLYPLIDALCRELLCASLSCRKQWASRYVQRTRAI